MTIDEQRRIYLEYMQMKIYQQDFHGVADAAMDLRELEQEEKHQQGRLAGENSKDRDAKQTQSQGERIAAWPSPRVQGGDAGGGDFAAPQWVKVWND